MLILTTLGEFEIYLSSQINISIAYLRGFQQILLVAHIANAMSSKIFEQHLKRINSHIILVPS